MPNTNSLGLDFATPAEEKPPVEQPPVEHTAEQPAEQPAETETTSQNNDAESKEKKKQPYVNPERVKTGGQQRVRISISLPQVVTYVS